MDFIEDEEKRHSEKSGSPAGLEKSSAAYCWNKDGYDDPAFKENREFRLHHYADYIIGTSTGG
jgi:hypothetical protein